MKCAFAWALPAHVAVSLAAGPPAATANRAPLQANAFDPLPLTLIPYGAGKLRITVFRYMVPGAGEAAK
jgi:hypothetical protein